MYNADGQFIMDLSTIYKDVKWKLYDDSGKVKVTDTKEAFQGAARPDVQEAYKYHCVEGTWEWTETTKPVPTSILVPVKPVLASETSSPRGNLGVTINGLVISASAPVDAILRPTQLPPLMIAADTSIRLLVITFMHTLAAKASNMNLT